MKNYKLHLIYIAELLRFHSAMIGGGLVTMGALCISHTLFDFRILLLLIFGVLILSCGMGLNEICDVEYDRKTNIGKILVRGVLSLKEAKIIVFIFLLISTAIGLYLAYPSLIATTILVALIVSGVCYDLFSKKTGWAGVLAGVWMFCLILFGAAVMGTPNLLAIAIALYCALYMVEACTIQGSIKDIATDPPANVALRLGSSTRNGIIFLSAAFTFLSVTLRSIQFVIFFVILLFLLPPLNPTYYMLISAFLGANIYLFVRYMCFSLLSQRGKLLRYFGIAGFFSYTLVSFTLSPFVCIGELLLLPGIALLWAIIWIYIITGSFLVWRH